MKIFVARLNYSSSSEDLQRLFEQHGDVVSAKVIFDRETGRSKGFGFVEMANSEDVQNAIKALDGTEFMERQIVVKQAHEQGS